MSDDKASGGLKGFFIDVIKAVLTSKEVKDMLQEMLDKAAQMPMEAINAEVKELGTQIQSLERSAIDGIDGLDGKMGNLPEQILSPLEGVLRPVAEVLSKFGNFPDLGGLFGPR